MKEITFILGAENRAADVWEMLGERGVVIEASCTYPATDGRNLRVVVSGDDAASAREAARSAGLGPVDENEVLIVDVPTQPGGLGHLASKVAATGAKLLILYMATGDRVVVGSDQLDKVAQVL